MSLQALLSMNDKKGSSGGGDNHFDFSLHFTSDVRESTSYRKSVVPYVCLCLETRLLSK